MHECVVLVHRRARLIGMPHLRPRRHLHRVVATGMRPRPRPRPPAVIPLVLNTRPADERLAAAHACRKLRFCIGS